MEPIIDLPSRRRLTATLALSAAGLLFPLAARSEPGVSSDTIALGQTTALTGPLGDLGLEILKGSKVYFDALNAKAGVHGRSIKLVTLDDAYETPRTLGNVKSLLENDSVFALFGTFGTPNNEALIPLAQKAGVPVLMPYSGAPSIRGSDSKGVYNLRASYADEVAKLVEHLTTLGIRKIAVVYQNNAFGREVLAAATAALGKRSVQPLMTASVENSASDAAAASEKTLASNPEAILLALAGKPTVEVIKQVSQRKRGTQMYALSVLATPANLRALGPSGVGVAISQVVPFPVNSTLPLVREYQQAMAAAGHSELSHLSLEGYVNARVAAEALRRAGKNLTRGSFMAAMDSIKGLNLGGMDVSFGNGAASGSHFVELTLVGSQGRLIK